MFQQAAQSSFLDLPQYETHCYGINASVPADGVVDLFQHNETRNMAVENPDAEVFTLNCVGSAIYQQGPNVPGVSYVLGRIARELLRSARAVHCCPWEPKSSRF